MQQPILRSYKQNFTNSLLIYKFSLVNVLFNHHKPHIDTQRSLRV